MHNKLNLKNMRPSFMEEEYYSNFPMGRATKIMRRSIFTFLQNYQYFTSTPTLLAVPFTISVLLSQTLLPSSHLFPLVHGRLRSLFLASGFPPSSELFSLLNLKLTQTILSFIFVSPFTFSFLLLSKASVIKTTLHKPSQRQGFVSFTPLLITQLCNSLLILSANATCFCLLVISFNCLDVFGFSSHLSILIMSVTGAIVYSIVLAHSYIICNLALILSGIENRGGFVSILKACVLIRDRTSTALSLSVPINMTSAAIEALFQYRVVRAYYNRGVTVPNPSIILEGMLIAYLYAMVLVLDAIIGSILLKSCKKAYGFIGSHQMDMYRFHQIEIQEKDLKPLAELKAMELLA